MKHQTKQRLALFLDGTWNTEDDSTNVLNAYHFTKEGLVDEEQNIIQKRYYDRGVGTSMFDSFTGGGFGLGLEKNVREAYNWLVDNYNSEADEIYIFGFSRGAYTARSLVGLIASCGLVKRGAPLTITQLWNGYAFISRNREIRDNDWWANELNKPQFKDYFRRINLLKDEAKCGKLINKSEALIKKWSRRVPIKYLGIYDTVGAIGIHALGIPGLRSRLDENHNLSPTTLLKNCRHALAIDEHRSSFRLTPLLDFVRNECAQNEISIYKDIIKQKWFAGAHSNIGGGYTNNVLSMRPLEWIMEGAVENEGLAILMPSTAAVIEEEIPQERDITDSFAELVGIVWPHFLREKRLLRPINQRDVVGPGYSLRTINEEVDESVFELARANETYAPANLIAYLKRHPEKDQYIEGKPLLGNRKPKQKWPGDTLSFTGEQSTLKDLLLSRVWLLIWSLLAAIGLSKACAFFWGEDLSIDSIGLGIIAGIFVFVDWAEAKLTLKVNFNPDAVITKASWNVIYWMRLLGILTFAIGVITFLQHCWNLVDHFNFSLAGIQDYGIAFKNHFFHLQNSYPVLMASAIVIILDVLGDKMIRTDFVPDVPSAKIDPGKIDFSISTDDWKPRKLALYGSILIALGLTALMLYGHSLRLPEDDAIISVRLLLIYLFLVVFGGLMNWVSKPTGKSRANLGSIVDLQSVTSKKQLNKLFNAWMSKLHRNWITEAEEKELKAICIVATPMSSSENQKILAWLRLREVLRTAIWRDLLGFIPLYSFILGTILLIGSEVIFLDKVNQINIWLGFGNVPPWLILILLTALADVLENTIHLKYIRDYPQGGSAAILFILGSIATLIKFIGFFIATLLCLFIIGTLILMVIGSASGGLTWFLACGLSYTLILIVLPILFRSLRQ